MSNTGAAYNLDGLLKANISHILNLSVSTRVKFPKRFEYMHVDKIHDNKSKENMITPYFESTSDFIEKARRQGGKVLVHCWRGRSRSVSTIIAYLMKEDGMSPRSALSLIQESRPDASPNSGYMDELEKYDKVLRQHRRKEHVAEMNTIKKITDELPETAAKYW